MTLNAVLNAPIAVNDTLTTGAVQEFLINGEYVGNPSGGQATTLDDGRIVVVWESGDANQDGSMSSVHGRVFYPDGIPATDEFLVNVEGFNHQSGPRITALGDRFFVSWTTLDQSQDGADRAVKGIIMNADGSAVTPEFLVNTDTISRQTAADVTTLENGNFVVSWRSLGSLDGQSGFSIHARVLDPDGNEVVPTFDISPEPRSLATFLNPISGNRFVATWMEREYHENGTTSYIYARVFNEDGTADTEAELISATEFGFGLHSIVQVSDTELMGVWRTGDPSVDGSGTAIVAQLFDDTLAPLEPQFVVASEVLGDQMEPCVTLLSDGRVLISWSTRMAENGAVTYLEIKARVLNADGTESVPEFLVNSDTERGQTVPFVTATANGGFFIGWRTNDLTQDGDGNALRGRLFNADGSAADAGSFTTEDAAVTFATDILLENDSDPDGDPLTITAVEAISALGATVTLNADGTITYDPTTAAALQALNEYDEITDSFSYTISDGNGGSDTATASVLVSGLNEIVRGTNPAEIFLGTAGIDTIFGGSGGDTFEGGAGDDVLYALFPGSPGNPDHIDRAIYAGAFGDFDFAIDYFLRNQQGDTAPRVEITDTNSADGLNEGRDLLLDMDEFEFGDGTVITEFNRHDTDWGWNPEQIEALATNGDDIIAASGNVRRILGLEGDDTLSGALELSGGDGNDTYLVHQEERIWKIFGDSEGFDRIVFEDLNFADVHIAQTYGSGWMGDTTDFSWTRQNGASSTLRVQDLGVDIEEFAFQDGIVVTQISRHDHDWGWTPEQIEVYATDGDDVFDAGGQIRRLHGADGNDVLSGALEISGGDGDDTYHVRQNERFWKIFNETTGNDTVVFDDLLLNDLIITQQTGTGWMGDTLNFTWYQSTGVSNTLRIQNMGELIETFEIGGQDYTVEEIWAMI